MEKVRPWCGQPSDRGQLKNRTELLDGWLGSRVVSVLDSGAERSGFKSQSRRCRVTVLGKMFTPIVFVPLIHQAAKLGTALLRVAGLAESNGSLLPGL